MKRHLMCWEWSTKAEIMQDLYRELKSSTICMVKSDFIGATGTDDGVRVTPTVGRRCTYTRQHRARPQFKPRVIVNLLQRDQSNSITSSDIRVLQPSRAFEPDMYACNSTCSFLCWQLFIAEGQFHLRMAVQPIVCSQADSCLLTMTFFIKSFALGRALGEGGLHSCVTTLIV